MISQSPYPFDPRVRRQAEKLARSGFEVDIICLPFKNEPSVEKFGNGITAHRIIRTNVRQDNVRRYLWLSFRFFIKTFLKLRKLDKKKDYALIQVHNMPEVHVFTAFLQKLKKVPILLDEHDLTPELLTSKWEGRLSRLVKPIIIFFEVMACRFSDHIITVTEGCKEILNRRSAPEEKVSVIYNTADTSIFPFNKRRVYKRIEKDAVLLYHGTVAERFGLHVIIDAMPYILNKIPGTVLKVYGKYDQEYQNYLNDKICEMNLAQNVILGDGRTHEELYEIMNDSDMEVVPYISNEYMNLSLSTKAFECASAGLPIIATDLKTMRSAFDDEAVTYAEDRNPRDFAEKIIELCLNPDRRKRMVWAAYQSIIGISGDIMEEKYLKIVENLTGLKALRISETEPKRFIRSERRNTENVN